MRALLKYIRLGPGLTTGAADDDPSGIATYSQAGAQFGYGQLWTAVFMLPFLIAIQEVCARIGAVTGTGIPSVIKAHYNKKILYSVVLLVCIANIINLGADIGSMAAAANLIIPINFYLLATIFSVVMVLAQILISYKTYAKILKWLCFSLLVYPLSVVMVSQPWLTVLKATFIPNIQFNFQFLFIITGIFGTTISPYLFFWQAQQEVEEEQEKEKTKKKKTNVRTVTKKSILYMRIDNVIGMLFSEITTWSIILVAATVLHANGITNIQSAADAAKAIEPLVHTFPHAGYIAKLIFAVGIIGLGLLSVPILAGTTAYALSTVLDLPKGLDLKFREAKGFYSIIIVGTFLGYLLNFIGINPIKSLVYSAVINGVVAVPLIFIIALIGHNKKIMGKYQSGTLSSIFVWLTFVAMAITAVVMFCTFGKS
jgi:NRAMP (natural resistance-associated macrophage protein)-like metal ion transporter